MLSIVFIMSQRIRHANKCVCRVSGSGVLTSMFVMSVNQVCFSSVYHVCGAGILTSVFAVSVEQVY